MKPRILVVDDDEAITQQLYWTLCEEYDVVTANDMPTAIRPPAEFARVDYEFSQRP